MTTSAILISIVAFVAAGALLRAAWRAERRATRWRGEALRLRATCSVLERDARETAALRAQLAEGAARSSALEAHLEERERALEEMRARLDGEFRAAASRALDAAQTSFLERANEAFSRHREVEAAEATSRRASFDAAIAPMTETLKRYEKGLADLREEQARARGELTGRIEDLARSANAVQAEARKLSTALRAGPRTRGRWGEEQLKNVVETAGMTAHVDFVEQASLSDGEARKTPDMVVNLPGGRVIAVDAKVSLAAYLDATETDDAAVRDALIAQHADDLWTHVKTLASRDYAAALRDSLDVVVMFVPGENYFAAAAEARPRLFQDAFDRKILLATPTTLVAILKAAAFNWRQEGAVRHAHEVAALAKDLYESVQTMSGRLADLGQAMERAVGKYNATVAGFERRVLPRARKFAEYELPGVGADIPRLKPIETTPATVAIARAEGPDVRHQDAPSADDEDVPLADDGR
ncbi:MAG: DNA recombination protein RmuC [Alphaproteobacteria bacterium]|nr:DNA recombination protein RmuC [Alphaproteobacteria bacterium]